MHHQVQEFGDFGLEGLGQRRCIGHRHTFAQEDGRRRWSEETISGDGRENVDIAPPSGGSRLREGPGPMPSATPPPVAEVTRRAARPPPQAPQSVTVARKPPCHSGGIPMQPPCAWPDARASKANSSFRGVLSSSNAKPRSSMFLSDNTALTQSLFERDRMAS